MADDWIKVAETIRASRAEVEAALTRPERLQAWWEAGWSGCAVTTCEIDPQPGGRFLVASKTKAGVEHFIRGRVLEAGPESLCFTWETDESRSYTSTVLVRLSERGSDTEVTVLHGSLLVDAERMLARKAWRQILAVLKRGLPRTQEAGIAAEVRRLGDLASGAAVSGPGSCECP